MATEQRIDAQKIQRILIQKLQSHMGDSGDYPTEIPGLNLFRRETPYIAEKCFYKPLIVMIAQGKKQTILGTDKYQYGADSIMFTGVDLPGTSAITEASPEHPYLSMTLDIRSEILDELSLSLPQRHTAKELAPQSLLLQQAEPEMHDAFLRLLELLDCPQRIPVLAPMIIKEIHYLLLTGPNGEQLWSFHSRGSRNNQISQAVSWLKNNIAQPILIEELARKVNMAPSTFHRYFKKITQLSPLQYQKRLRLHEAQRLMLVDNLDTGSACITVGYESQSQFNREYKRLFGDPPRKNVTRLRQNPDSSHSQTTRVSPT